MSSENDNGEPSGGNGNGNRSVALPPLKRRAGAFLQPAERPVTRRDFVEGSASLLLLGAGASLLASGTAEASRIGAPGDLPPTPGQPLPPGVKLAQHCSHGSHGSHGSW